MVTDKVEHVDDTKGPYVVVFALVFERIAVGLLGI